jgi:hypothetical protein
MSSTYGMAILQRLPTRARGITCKIVIVDVENYTALQ